MPHFPLPSMMVVGHELPYIRVTFVARAMTTGKIPAPLSEHLHVYMFLRVLFFEFIAYMFFVQM